MSKRLKVVVAESSLIIREGLLAVLSRLPELTLDLVEIGDLAQLRPQLKRLSPDILIVNPALLGLFPLAQLKAETGCAEMKCVALQTAVIDSAALRSYDATLSLYDQAEQIRDCIASLGGEESAEERQETLSAREKEIVVCIVKGMTNKQIAEQLCISAHTVITHRRNIVAKLQIHSSAGLTIYAIVNKLVELSDVKDTISEI